MPGWIYPFIWLFLWLIQSRLANQHSITKLLHGGSLIGFNLHNGGTLGKWGLNCFSISPSCRLDRFMDLKHVWGIDFIYFIIHSLVCCTQRQASCRSVTITGETFLLSWTMLGAGNPIYAGNEKTVSSAGVGLWKRYTQTPAKAHPHARHCGHNIGYLWHMSCLSDQISFFFFSFHEQKSPNNCWYYIAVVPSPVFHSED